MLILNRDINERIIIGDDVWVIFLGMRGDKARIGFSAPTYLSIHREEIYNKIKSRQNLKSSWHEKPHAIQPQLGG